MKIFAILAASSLCLSVIATPNCNAQQPEAIKTTPRTASGYEMVLEPAPTQLSPKAQREAMLAYQRTMLLMQQRATGEYAARPTLTSEFGVQPAPYMTYQSFYRVRATRNPYWY